MSNLINLTFHGIGIPERHLTEGESDVWLSKESFHYVLDQISPTSPVHITFDDGNASDARIALPALMERGLTGTFFLSASRIGQPGYLTTTEAAELTRHGMALASHGFEHVPWRKLSSTSLREDISRSTSVIEKLSGRPVTAFACPFGAYDRNVLRVLRSAQALNVYTSDGGVARSGAWLQSRTTVKPANSRTIVQRLMRAADLHTAHPANLLQSARIAIKRLR